MRNIQFVFKCGWHEWYFNFYAGTQQNINVNVIDSKIDFQLENISEIHCAASLLNFRYWTWNCFKDVKPEIIHIFIYRCSCLPYSGLNGIFALALLLLVHTFRFIQQYAIDVCDQDHFRRRAVFIVLELSCSMHYVRRSHEIMLRIPYVLVAGFPLPRSIRPKTLQLLCDKDAYIAGPLDHMHYIT